MKTRSTNDLHLLASVAGNPLPESAKEPFFVAPGTSNNDASPARLSGCVHEIFTRQCDLTPDALAIADPSASLTYAELNQRAGELAAHLVAFGVGPDDCVAVCLERSVEFVVALLAVLKAGGAYVPLDPANPDERLRFMLEDSQALVLVTRDALRPRFPASLPTCRVVCMDVPATLPAIAARTDSVISVVTPRNLAYVIYTSGSTGRPKGVEVEHASLVNLIAWHQRVYAVTPDDRASLLAAPGFDASVWELWPYLTAGASVHIPAEEIRVSTERLPLWLAEKQITLAFMPTPLAEALLDADWPKACSLRALLTGGDQLHRHPPENFPCALYNHYGPTENTVVTTWTEVPPNSETSPPSIGRPIDHVRVHVLDEELQHVAPGAPGELYVGGASLARGYRGRPELTAGRFIADPFSDKADDRLYRTGDIVRQLPDGNIQFVGRKDDQVKIRGYRIELGEIESALRGHRAVREAAVVARENPAGEKRLVAYVVPAVGGEFSADVFRAHLKRGLPDEMVPAHFIQLEKLPLTTNGKIDRAVLPDVSVVAADVVAPRTPVEKTLALIWREVLGMEHIGIDDNFFELGGHSLMATQVISRVRRNFSVELPLRDLFDAPTLAGLAVKIATAQVQAINKIAVPAASAANAGTLSFSQERLWFLEQLQPGQSFNNIPIAVRLNGVLNRQALERALAEVVTRHEPLRTVFHAENGRPVMSIEEDCPLSLAVEDLSAMPAGERDVAVQKLINAEARTPFDLSRSPLLRARLVRLSDRENLLLLTAHHIACDGWSMGVFYRELAALYDAFARGAASPLPPLPVRFADFARWQREWLQGDVYGDQLAYWKNHLRGPLPVLDLPTARVRPPLQEYRGSTRFFTLPAQLSARLKSLARREEVTLYMLLLGAFQTLLHRYSGQSDIIVGSPIAGRSWVETEKLVGFFLNILPMRGDLAGDPTFSELLRRTRQTALDAYAHPDLPFEKLVDALQLERDLSRSPLFQAMFILQNEPLRPLELPGLKLQPVNVHNGTAKFDLLLSLEEVDGGLAGFLEYSTELFDESTMERLLGHFETLLQGIVADPGQKLSTLPLLTAAEKNRFLEWNSTTIDFPADKTIHQMFEEQVARTPDAVALVCHDEPLTYGELNARADGLAGRLRALGVGPEIRVGISVERSLDMMVGLLGILKAGGCYVPLDPAYPKERLSFMLEDSQARVLVTQAGLKDRLTFPAQQTLLVDGTNTIGETVPPANTATTATNLAYVIYTSGSTGKPKGVMLTHRNVSNFFTAMDQVLGNTPGVWLAVTSISFDISVLELFWTLTRGFKVVIQPAERRIAAVTNELKIGQWRSLPEQIIRHGVTHMQCTPSLAGSLVSARESQLAMRRLGKLLLGGEALPDSLARQFRELLTGDFINMYGPTETTVWSTSQPLTVISDLIPIGRPIANTEIHILDKHLQPVPVGVPGELFIGGEGVARGYLNRPELTAERFIQHPFKPETTARLYRTGDLARFRPDGVVEFLGRMDQQVKLRGHRIELGEIESILRQHEDVRECVVHVAEFGPGDQRLVAYLVPVAPKVFNGELRLFLKPKLPDYMIPAAFVTLERLPLTPNGKVDRKALPAPGATAAKPEPETVAPRSEAEQVITRIWKELLQVGQVGSNDNFFDLGGHSLLVVEAQARIQKALGVELPVVRLFQYPTVSSLARYIQSGGPIAPDRHAPAQGKPIFLRRPQPKSPTAA